MKKRGFIFLTILGTFIVLMSSDYAMGQKSETSSVVKVHSPKKATLYSAVLPGLGQAYNRKYWKMPIIYAGFATLGYFISMNHKEYVKFREAYVYVSSGDSTSSDNDYIYKYTPDNLKQGMDYYRRNLELTYVLTAALYILNIIDAAVDAHFYDFDISEDISMRIEPSMDMYKPTLTSGGLKITLRF